MRDQIEQAGLNTPKSRLYLAAVTALKQHNRSPALAVEPFLSEVLHGGALVMELMGLSQQAVRERAMAYLQQRAAEMTNEIKGASHAVADSQGKADRSPEARMSHHPQEGQKGIDRPGSRNGMSQVQGESHSASDRSVAVSAHSRGAPKRQAAATRLPKSAVLAYQRNSIFARQFGSGIKEIGQVTRFDVVQTIRRGMIDQTVGEGLLELEWPDEQKTKLHAVASEAQVKAVFERAYKKLDALGITHATS